VRETVAQWLDNNGNPSHEIAQETVELLKAQLQAKDEQISRLHQLMAMDRQECERLAQQLETKDRLLEDQRHKRGWWSWRK
jgi:hypothetical protein